MNAEAPLTVANQASRCSIARRGASYWARRAVVAFARQIFVEGGGKSKHPARFNLSGFLAETY